MVDATPSPHSAIRPGWLARFVIIHFGSMMLLVTWGFGGQSPLVRQAIAWWGAVAIPLFIAACWPRGRGTGEASWPALRHLWPLWLYDALVITSCFNPGFKEVVLDGQRSLALADPIPWLPSAARPHLAWEELWQFNVLLLSAFNLYLVLPGRRHVRGMLYFIATNAVALAVFGTFQKLVGAKGLWFGLVESPNPRFFATFTYYNHWGAFTLLATSVCLALLFHAFRRGGERDLWHSPVPMGALVTMLLGASVPLSASRSSTMLIGLLLLAGLVCFLLRLVRRQRERRASIAQPVAAIITAVVLALAAIGYLGRDTIAQRVQQTTTQLSATERATTFNTRLTLYRDTWRMAVERPWFGWGLESYAHVFRIFNTQRAVEKWLWIPFYAEAHSDWLQSLTETGFVGTTLLVLLGFLPWRAIPWRRVGSGVPRWLLTGCGFVLAYAWVEMPFTSPAVVLTFCGVFYCALRYAALDARAQSGETAAR